MTGSNEIWLSKKISVVMGISYQLREDPNPEISSFLTARSIPGVVDEIKAYIRQVLKGEKLVIYLDDVSHKIEIPATSSTDDSSQLCVPLTEDEVAEIFKLLSKK